jgi:hypothetical protein
MLPLVEYVNNLGVYTSFSCLAQRVNPVPTPGIVVKRMTVQEVSCVIKGEDPEFHELIQYFEWNGFHPITGLPDVKYTDVTLYFPGGIPDDFRA